MQKRCSKSSGGVNHVSPSSLPHNVSIQERALNSITLILSLVTIIKKTCSFWRWKFLFLCPGSSSFHPTLILLEVKSWVAEVTYRRISVYHFPREVSGKIFKSFGILLHLEVPFLHSFSRCMDDQGWFWWRCLASMVSLKVTSYGPWQQGRRIRDHRHRPRRVWPFYPSTLRTSASTFHPSICLLFKVELFYFGLSSLGTSSFVYRRGSSDSWPNKRKSREMIMIHV